MAENVKCFLSPVRFLSSKTMLMPSQTAHIPLPNKAHITGGEGALGQSDLF